MNTQNELMSNFTKISNIVIRDPNLSTYAKAIFMLLKSYSPSFPSYSHILKQTGIGSRSTLSKGLSDLEWRRLIRRTKSPTHKSTVYEFPPPNKLYFDSSTDGLELVQEVDTNKTKLKIPNNKASEASTDKPVESSMRAEIFAKAQSSLGTGAGNGYKPQERPTFIIEALEK